MRYENIKHLKQKIKKLEEENEFLQKGIDTREDAHNFVCEQRDRHMALCQELVFLLLYMESIEALLKEDYSSNSKIIKKAITRFKVELTNGFGSTHLITKLTQNKLDNNDITL